MKVKAIFLSDIHLGSKGCNAKELVEVLKKYEPKYLFLVGDFIDGWLLQKRHYWKQTYTDVIQRILKLSKKKTKVIVVAGNHDEFLRDYTNSKFGNIEIVDEYLYDGYFVVHGDKYDGVVKLHWLGKLGAAGYELAIELDRYIKRLGVKFSLSSFLKKKVKEAVKFITKFEEELVRQSKLRKCKGVICGHIHKPEDKIIEGIHYLNCGDWIENNSYIIQTKEGDYKLCYLNK